MQARAGRGGGGPLSQATERVLALLPDQAAADELVALLGGLDDAERKALARPVRAAVAAGNGRREDGVNLALAVLGCLGGARPLARALDDVPLPRSAEPLAARVLADRRPEWLTELPAVLLDRPHPARPHAGLVHAMVVAGLVPAPVSREYAGGLVGRMSGAWGWRGPTLLEVLRETGSELAEDVLTALRAERVGRILQFHDKSWSQPRRRSLDDPPEVRLDQTWRVALTSLSAEGRLDRGLLLDAALAAFLADWAPADQTWYVAFHDALDPTTDELQARQDTYARLIAAPFGPAVTRALAALGRLLAAGRLDVDGLLTTAGSPLVRPEKGNARSTLDLLASVAAAEPGARERVAEVVAVACDHAQTDVREHARALVAELAPGDVPAPDVVEPERAPAPREPWVPAPVSPTTSADEVAELLARLIEEADDPVEVERALDGVLRWSGSRPRTADALAHRAEQVVAVPIPGAFSGEDLRADLAATALVWLGREQPSAGFHHTWMVGIKRGRAFDAPPPDLDPGAPLDELVSRRVHEVCVALPGGRHGGLLSLPTSSDGSLDAATLNRRLADLPRRTEALPIDAALALFRVPPEEHGELRSPLLHRAGRALTEQARLLQRYQPRWSLVVAVDGDVRYRSADGRRDREPPPPAMWQDEAPLPGGLTEVLLAVLDRSDPLDGFAAEVFAGDAASRYTQVTACWPLLVPHRPDLLAAAAHPRLHRARTRSKSGIEPLLDALGRSSRPFGDPGHCALLLGLGAGNGVERTHAVDAVLDLAARGTVDGPALGTLLAALLRTEAVVGSRVAESLDEVLRVEPATAGLVVDCLVAALDALEGRRDAHRYLDLLAAAAAASGRTVRLPEVFAAAARSSARTQLARACRRVPQPPEAAP